MNILAIKSAGQVGKSNLMEGGAAAQNQDRLTAYKML